MAVIKSIARPGIDCDTETGSGIWSIASKTGIQRGTVIRGMASQTFSNN